MANTQPATEKATFNICARKSSKISLKTLHRKTYFIYFCEFVYNFLSKTVRGSILSFLTPSRSFEFTFSVDFSISKESFALQLIYSATELQQRPKFDIFQKALFVNPASSKNLVLIVIPIAVEQFMMKLKFFF